MTSFAELAAQPSQWPYEPRAGGSERLEPCVPVTFTGPADSARTVALVDSGADHTTLPIEFAEPLGVNIAAAEIVPVMHMTPDGPQSVACYRPTEPLTAEVAGRTFELDAVFGPAWEPILGRSDLFRAFVVTVDERNRRTVLSPYPD